MDLVAGRVYADERRPIRHIDGFLLLVTAILLLLGFFLIYSATNQTLEQDRLDPFLRVNKQMVTAAIGVVLILVMATFDYRFLKVYAGFIYAGVVVTLLLVRVPFLGSSQAGAQRWFEVAGFQVTPSEFAKLGLIVMLAASLSEMRHSLPTIQDVIRLCGLVLVPMVLVFTQPDIGTSIVMVAIAAGMFLVAGVSGRHLAALVVICLVLIAAAFQLGVIKEYQLDRLRAFLDRQNTPADVRYNLDQAEIAVGSGGLFGQGYLHGRQTTLDYVPEQHTDFIFTVAGEEFGFVGAVFVLTLFALLLWRSIRIAFLSKDPFGTYLATGVAIMFAVQMFVNIGMVIGIMPITGIPLPFLSYGGSSMLASCIGVGTYSTCTCAASSSRRVRGSRYGGSERAHRDPPQEHRAVRAGVFERHVPIHRPRRHPGDREAQTDSLVRPGVELFGLLEGLEDPLERVFADTGALVDDPYLDPGLRFVDPHDHLLELVRELEPVLDELLQDAKGGHPVEGCEHRPARSLDLHAGREPRDLLRDIDHVGVLGEPRLDHPFEPGDQTCESLRAHHERAQHLVPLLQRPGSLRQGLGHPEDDGHGRAELVAQPAHQLVTASGSLEQRLLRELELAGTAALALERLGELPDHTGRDLRGDHAAAGRRLADRVEDLVAVGVLQDVAGGACDQHLPHGVLVVHTGQGDDADLREG